MAEKFTNDPHNVYMCLTNVTVQLTSSKAFFDPGAMPIPSSELVSLTKIPLSCCKAVGAGLRCKIHKDEAVKEKHL